MKERGGSGGGGSVSTVTSWGWGWGDLGVEFLGLKLTGGEMLRETDLAGEPDVEEE